MASKMRVRLPARIAPYFTWWSVPLILFIVAANVVLPIVVYNAVSSSEEGKLADAFQAQAIDAREALRAELVRTTRAVANLRMAVHLAAEDLTAIGFNNSVRFLSLADSVGALAWIPRVAGENRSAFEAHVRDINRGSPVLSGPFGSLYEYFTITQLRNASDIASLGPAQPRSTYFPILYLWPPTVPVLVGFDTGSLPQYFGAVGDAIVAGDGVLVTDVVILTIAQGSDRGVLYYLPVYQSVATPPASDRVAGSMGLVAASASIPAIVRAAAIESDDVIVHLFEEDGTPLYSGTGAVGGPGDVPARHGNRFVSNFLIANRQWTYVAVCGDVLASSYESNDPALFSALTALGIFLLLLLALFGVWQLVRARLNTAASERRRRQIAAMIGYVNHELRNPLQGVLGLVDHAREVSKDMLVSSAPSKEGVGVVLDDLEDTSRLCDWLTHICNDVLDIRQLEEGRLTIKLENASLDSLVADVVGIVQPKLSEKQLLTLSARVYASGVRLRCDPVRVKQLLLNLVTNAIKYSESGPIQLSVEPVSLQGVRSGGTTGNPAALRFTVSDCGQGIPEEKQPLVFGPFTQLDGGGRHQGAGLGLYLCSMLVEALGGSIGFASQFGVGSTFWFEIPFVPADDGEGDATDHTHTAAATRSRRARTSPHLTAVVVDNPREGAWDAGVDSAPRMERLELHEVPTPRGREESGAGGNRGGCAAKPATHLVCDDSRINRLVLRRYLESVCPGCRVVEAENGLQAVEMASVGAYDAIWMDVRMPLLDGIEATKRIRALPGHAQTPIIGVTGDVTAEEVSFYRRVGMDRAVSKPVTRAHIAEIVRDTLRTAAAEVEE